ncbi:Early nodulin-like protein [Thalictrum thalictroides]|uniref:Early nodulin-like protein n=1 Tax=Thalictrum thalictroides TaxID=46969 RepID=A0A7J6V415_THATH|nr:Early nodulin-like protein [Thalictrum thalictroides]
MAASMNRLVGFLFVVIALVSCTTAQTTHVVGGSTGWAIPPSATTYSNWASNQVFRVGDSLVFNFAGMHDVATVTRAAYDACDASSPIGPIQTTSPVTITLSSQGQQYYFCAIQGHCSSGQKLAINVVGAAASPPPTTTPSSPPPRTPTPPTGSATPPTTTPTSSPPPPTNTATPPTTSVARPPTAGGPPSNSAMGLAVSGFSVTFLSIAMAFFF